MKFPGETDLDYGNRRAREDFIYGLQKKHAPPSPEELEALRQEQEESARQKKLSEKAARLQEFRMAYESFDNLAIDAWIGKNGNNPELKHSLPMKEACAALKYGGLRRAFRAAWQSSPYEAPRCYVWFKRDDDCDPKQPSTWWGTWFIHSTDGKDIQFRLDGIPVKNADGFEGRLDPNDYSVCDWQAE